MVSLQRFLSVQNTSAIVSFFFFSSTKPKSCFLFKLINVIISALCPNNQSSFPNTRTVTPDGVLSYNYGNFLVTYSGCAGDTEPQRARGMTGCVAAAAAAAPQRHSGRNLVLKTLMCSETPALGGQSSLVIRSLIAHGQVQKQSVILKCRRIWS